jgi:hypothetical protein
MKVLIFGDIHGLVGKADIPTIDIIEEAEKCLNLNNIDIFLTHGCPLYFTIEPKEV